MEYHSGVSMMSQQCRDQEPFEVLWCMLLYMYRIDGHTWNTVTRRQEFEGSFKLHRFTPLLGMKAQAAELVDLFMYVSTDLGFHATHTTSCLPSHMPL